MFLGDQIAPWPTPHRTGLVRLLVLARRSRGGPSSARLQLRPGSEPGTTISSPNPTQDHPAGGALVFETGGKRVYRSEASHSSKCD
jgi:hypothetical protein